MIEKTLVIVKPDAYALGLTGDIIARFEHCGLRLKQLRISVDEDEALIDHYPRDDEWLSAVGQKTLADFERVGISPKTRLGTEDAIEIGNLVRGWLVTFLQSGPIVPMIISGNRAIEKVRRMIGDTIPAMAPPGTIRGDYSSDSAELANSEGRPVHNLVHASGDANEAARELALWFR